jgi:hypothetical protein
VSAQGLEVAYGLSPYLHRFARDRGAAAYWKWKQAGLTQQPIVPRNMHKVFEEVAQQVHAGLVTRIHFNLDGIHDPVASADRAARGLMYQHTSGLPIDWSAVGLTNAELNAIRGDPRLLSITTFYRQAGTVSSPF